MDHVLTVFLLYFTSFFSIINPIGVMPVFMTMTAKLDRKARRRTAIKAVITAFITLMLFALGGQMMFRFFGISVNGFRIVGGIIFFVMGFDMLKARLSHIKVADEDVREYVNDISITPLGIPMLAGPGAITNAIVLMEDSHTLAMQGVLLASIVVTLILVLITFISGGPLIRLLGDTGNKILLKLMGLIVMVIAVEFFFAGLTPIVQGMLR